MIEEMCAFIMLLIFSHSYKIKYLNILGLILMILDFTNMRKINEQKRCFKWLYFSDDFLKCYLEDFYFAEVYKIHLTFSVSFTIAASTELNPIVTSRI